MKRVTTIRLIAGREIAERLRGRATWILTGITTLLAVALIVGPAVFRQPTRPIVVGLVGTSAQALAPALQTTAKAAGVDITTMNVASDSAARSELAPSQSGGRSSRALGQLLSSLQGRQATLDVALRVDTNSATIEFYQTVSPTISALLRAVVEEVHQRDVLIQAGVPPAWWAPRNSPNPLPR